MVHFDFNMKIMIRDFLHITFYQIANVLFPRYIIKVSWIKILLNDFETQRLSQVGQYKYLKTKRRKEIPTLSFISKFRKNYYSLQYFIGVFHDNKLFLFCLVLLFLKNTEFREQKEVRRTQSSPILINVIIIAKGFDI